MGVVVLIEDVGDESRTVVTPAQLGGKHGDPIVPRRRQPPLQTPACVVQFDPDVLDRVVLIALEAAPFGELFGANAEGFMDRQFLSLVALVTLVRTLPFAHIARRALEL